VNENSVDSSIRVVAALAREVGRADLAADADALAERTAEGLFYVACVGQFKRGKSTLINALVGRPLLPVGVVPITSAVTIVRYGDAGARVRFASGQWRDAEIDRLAQYVSEEENAENAKGVAVVEVSLPSPLLASGMCLVDTPGIGSVFAGNTAVTRGFVLHIDAALVVVGADPPISGDELELVADVGQHVRDLIFVVNKADRLSDIERRQAIEFTERTVGKRLGRSIRPIFEASALERLRGQETYDWRRMEEALRTLAARSGADLVRAAQSRGLALLVERVRHEIDEQHGALARPVAESEQRIADLKRCAADAETALRELDHRMTAEQERLDAIFIQRRSRFLADAKPDARRALDIALASSDERGPSLRKRAIAVAQNLSKEWILPRLRDEEAAAETLYRESMQRFIDMANQFLTSSPGVGALSARIGADEAFRVKSRFFPNELLTVVPESVWTRIADSLRARSRSLAAIGRAAGEYLDHMLETNSARIQNDLIERVLESRRSLESEIRAQLREVYRSAEHALERAGVRHAEGAAAVRAELERVAALRERIAALGAHEAAS
jgi:predicted GTPase